MKKIIALILAVLTATALLVGCTTIGEDGKGAVIDVYMGTKTINLDPAIAYTDENSVKIISLIFEGLFKMDQNGRVTKALAEKYELGEDRYGNKKMTIWLNNTYWSDGSLVQANDIVYAWKRILEPGFNSGAASMLYAIQGAKDAKDGKIGIDDIGLYSLATKKLEIIFEEGADVDEFIANMASPALVPLRENKVSPYADTWSYSSRDLSTNGPFRLKKFTGVSSEGEVDKTGEIILERSTFYYLDQDVRTEDLDKYVVPYRIVFHFVEPLDLAVVASTRDTDVVSMFNNSQLFYVSNLTKETATNFTSKQLKYTNLASTYSYMFNTSNPLFASAKVRYAFSIALDRAYAADTVGCGATAATGFLPSMIFNTGRGTSFRKVGGAVLSADAQLDLAKQLIKEEGIDPDDVDELYLYYRMDETNDSYASTTKGFNSKEKALARYVKTVWDELGFSVVLVAADAQTYEAALNNREYDIIGLDYQMLSAYPLYDLAPFATTYSGSVDTNQPTEDGGYVNVPGMSGYSSEAYDALIASAFDAKTQKERAAILHDAEKLLLEEGGIVPVIYNCDCYVASGELSGIKTTFYGVKDLTRTALKNYEQYLAVLPDKEKKKDLTV